MSIRNTSFVKRPSLCPYAHMGRIRKTSHDGARAFMGVCKQHRFLE